jgi:hypothetical protein
MFESMDYVFNITKSKSDWKSETAHDQMLIAKAKTKREVIARTIIHAKTLGNSRIVIFDKDGKVSEERTIKKVPKKELS